MTRRLVPPEIVRTANRALDLAFELHTEIGPGCFEKVYELGLERLLLDAGHRVQRQVPISFEYRGVRMPVAFRADLLVDDAVVVEAKAAHQLHPAHISQVRTYLRLSSRPVGLLLCFGAQQLREGYERIVHPDFAYFPVSRRRSGDSGDLGDSGAASAASTNRAGQRSADMDV